MDRRAGGGKAGFAVVECQNGFCGGDWGVVVVVLRGRHIEVLVVGGNCAWVAMGSLG